MRNASGGRWRLSSRGTPGVERASVRAAVLTPNRAAVLVIVVVVLTANALVLVGGFDPNPMGTRSELASSLTAGALPGETTIDPNDGFISQALGHRAALDVLHLRMPWWDSEEGTGAPLAAGMTSGALYPPTLLNAFANGLIYERVLLELVAGLSLFFLLRRLALARAACMAAAIAFALDGTFAWLAITPINPIPLLPVLLLGLEAAYTRSVARARGGWWLIAVAGALSLYAGSPRSRTSTGCWPSAGSRGAPPACAEARAGPSPPRRRPARAPPSSSARRFSFRSRSTSGAAPSGAMWTASSAASTSRRRRSRSFCSRTSTARSSRSATRG